MRDGKKGVLLLMTCMSVCLVSWPAAMFAQEAPEVSHGEGAWDERAQQHRMRAELLAHVDPEAERIQLGVLMQPDEHWHVYWKNSGDSGLATAITWRATYADGSTWESKAMSWPVPEVFVTGGVVTTFGYDEVLHTVTLPWPEASDSDTPKESLPIKVSAHINYLTCEVECIPGDQTLWLTILPEQSAAPHVQELFERHATSVPVEVKGQESPAEVSTRLSQSALRVGDEGMWRISVVPCTMRDGEQVCLDWSPRVDQGKEHLFIPELADGVKLDVERVQLDAGPLNRMVIDVGWRVTATRPVHQEVELAGVLRMRDEQGRARGLRVAQSFPMVASDAPVSTFDLEPLEQVSSASVPDTSSEASEKSQDVSLLYALWLAFVGGLLLNVMPCVFPVLSIKVAGVAQIAHHSRAKMIRHGLAYTAGILSAMGALALAVIAMRVAGVEAGWGFQFQSPLFLLGLLGGLTLFAVNLFGAFDIGTPMGSQMQQVLDEGARREGGELRQSFLEGLMCVLLATPCSAPFMGTAVGFALTSHGVIVAAIFLMLGLGLAFPFVVLCALPGWAKLLPKPGGWLDVLKHVLGMCLLVTCVWLLWLLGQGQGVDGMAIGLLWMCGLAAVGGIYGLVQYREARMKWGVVGVLIVAMLSGFWLGASRMKDPAQRGQAVEQGERWKAFDEEAIARDVAEGKIVFVDFTADWCITCKVNENGPLMNEALLAEAEKLGVVWYKADWTHRDDRIRAILLRHGKGGVPMYLIYGRNSPSDGLLLPELLTVEMIREGFARVR